MTISIEHENIVRNGRVVVKPAALTFEAGARVGLIGLNGAGKSTWLHAIAGIIPGAKAAVKADGQVLAHMAFTAQHPALPRWLTVDEALDVLIAPSGRRLALHSRWSIHALLSRRGRELSKGEMQFIASIITLECAGTLRCLDEPFAALDLKRRRELINGIVDPTSSASSVTIVTAQVASDLFETCTEILMLRDGELTALGSVQALSGGDPSDPRGTFERQIVEALSSEAPAAR